MKIIKVFIVIFICSVCISCGSDNKNKEYNACVDRGISYFKEIGAYPTLKSSPNKGRSAETVAKERCKRTTTAF